MSYTLPTWVNGSTALNATNLNDYSAAVNDLDVRNLTAVAVKTSNYTAAAGDFVPVNTTSGAVTITLPTAPSDKTAVAVKHVIQGGTNAVTIACGGSDVFNKTGGATSFTLSLLAQGAVMMYNASGAIWYIVSDDLPLAQLDLRYATPNYATSRAVALAVVLGS